MLLEDGITATSTELEETCELEDSSELDDISELEDKLSWRTSLDEERIKESETTLLEDCCRVSATAILELERTTELDDTMELDDGSELDITSELDRTSVLKETATLELDKTSELELWAVTAVSLDWAASVSASNSANRSRGWANDDTAKRLATQTIKENLHIRK